VILSEWYCHLYRTDSFHFWIVPFMCIVPMVVGYSFQGTARKDAESRSCAEAGIETSAMIGFLVGVAYVAITTVALNYL
jgi:hypothetical protein